MPRYADPATTKFGFRFPFTQPVPGSENNIKIQRIETSLGGITEWHQPAGINISQPVAVAIGPYHIVDESLKAMQKTKEVALNEFCRVANLSPEEVQERILSVAASARGCYAPYYIIEEYLDLQGMDTADDEGSTGNDDDAGGGTGNRWRTSRFFSSLVPSFLRPTAGSAPTGNYDGVDDDGTGNATGGPHNNRFARMMLLDGCFLLQFMVSMCMYPEEDSNAARPVVPDPLMSRWEVHTRIDGIIKDIMLVDNQIPWTVLEALMELRPAAPVPLDRFLSLMASAFDAGNDNRALPLLDGAFQQRPPHLLGLFHRRQVGLARTQNLRVPRMAALCSTAVELAEMGVKLTASKTKKFGDMSMVKRKWRGLSPFGELSLAPVVLNDMTASWLINMAAYEASLGAMQADNFAVSSYLSVVALLVNRQEDVQEFRVKGIINSTLSDRSTLEFFKWAAPGLRAGYRYSEVLQALQEYRQERWMWIPIHRFFYKNYKTIVAVLSFVGVVAGLFKTILSLKQPQK